MKFWEFREKLSEKILTYNPTSRLYWGDENMRVSDAKIKNKRNIGIPKRYNYNKKTITLNTFKRSRHTRHRKGRLYGDMEIFHKHVFQREM